MRSHAQAGRLCARAAVLALILAASVALSGCWDRIEINDLAIVGALAIDGNAGGVEVTAELFRPQAQVGAAPTTPGANLRTATIATGQGESVKYAIRCLGREAPRRPYTSQIVAVIVSEEYAREGLQELLDLWVRDPKSRITSYLLVARGRAADIITGVGAGIAPTVASQVEGLRETIPFDGRSTVATMHEVVMGLVSDGRTAVTGVVELAPVPQTPVLRSPSPGEGEQALQPAVANVMRLTGVAILKDAKLQSILPASSETKAIVASAGRIEGSILDIFVPGIGGAGESGRVSLEVTRVAARSRIETEGGLKGTVEITMDVDLASQRAEHEITAADVQKIEASAEDYVRGVRMRSIGMLQSISCDALHLADALHRKDPRLWADLKDRWDEVFAALDVEVEVQARLRHVGMSKGSAWKAQGP